MPLTAHAHSCHSAADERVITRRVGYSKRGQIAKTDHYFFHHGERCSVLDPFVIDEAFLDICIIEGGFDNDTFYMAGALRLRCPYSVNKNNKAGLPKTNKG